MILAQPNFWLMSLLRLKGPAPGPPGCGMFGPPWFLRIKLVSNKGSWKEAIWTGPPIRSLGGTEPGGAPQAGGEAVAGFLT